MHEVKLNYALKHCPFCGENVKIYDHTDALYGFDGYEIMCSCGCHLKSSSPREHYFEGNKYCTPITEKAKDRELMKLLLLWEKAKR